MYVWSAKMTNYATSLKNMHGIQKGVSFRNAIEFVPHFGDLVRIQIVGGVSFIKNVFFFLNFQ